MNISDHSLAPIEFKAHPATAEYIREHLPRAKQKREAEAACRETEQALTAELGEDAA